MRLPSIARDVHQLLFPSRCCGCGELGSWWCESCNAIENTVIPWLVSLHGARISVAGEYQTLAGAMSSYKDGGVRSLRGFLIQRLARAVTVHGLSKPVLVPVPSSHGSIRRRGVDLTAKLAADTATVIGGTSVPALRWSSRRQMQKKLDARERQRNMFQALNADKDILPSRGSIIVVDDVLTTGATMGAALAALRTAGVSADRGSVICATRQNLTETFSSSGR